MSRKKRPIRRMFTSTFGEAMTQQVMNFSFGVLKKTLHYHWVVGDPFFKTVESKRPFIVSFFHEDLILAALLGIRELKEMRSMKLAVLISSSRDGRMISNVVGKHGVLVITGSSTRGGVEGFIGLAHAIKNGYVGCVAVDGPKGPRRQVKEGVVKLAQLTGALILPGAAGYSRRLCMNSWDRIRIPYPFSHGYGSCADPIEIPKDLPDEEIQPWCKKIQETLLSLRQTLPYDRD